MTRNSSKAFPRIWLRRGNMAIAAILLGSKKEVSSILVFHNGILIERSVPQYEFVEANEVYWNYGVLTKWPVEDKLTASATVEEYDLVNMNTLKEVNTSAGTLWIPLTQMEG